MAGPHPWESHSGRMRSGLKRYKRKLFESFKRSKDVFGLLILLPFPTSSPTGHTLGPETFIPWDRIIETAQPEFPRPSAWRGKQFSVRQPNRRRGSLRTVNAERRLKCHGKENIYSDSDLEPKFTAYKSITTLPSSTNRWPWEQPQNRHSHEWG